MDIKRLFIFVLGGISLAINAQTPIKVNLKGEKSIILCGTEFPVILDESYRTAKIADNNAYKIDYRKLAILKTRKLKQIGKSKKITIPSTLKIGNVQYTVTTLGWGVFAGFHNIDSVEIPNTVTTIENEAFYYTSIKSVALPSSLEFIGNRAFARTALKKVEIPSSVEYIGSNAFARTSLKEVTIPAEIENLGDSAFLGSDLEKVELKSTIEHIGKDVFKNCKRLTKIVLPNPNIPIDKLFAENKSITIDYVEYGNNSVAIAPKKKKKSKEKKVVPVVYATSSDVDVNIPFSERNNNETFAIIIANEEYEKVAKVECAHRDGRSFLKYCQNTLGIPETNIRYVEDATLGNILEILTWIKNVAQVFEGDAKIILYYAGHGIPDESNGTAYLLPVDVAANNLAGAYSLNKMYQLLGSLKAKSVTLFLDACFSGSLRGEGMLTAARSVAIEVKEENPEGNMVVFSASKGDETAYPYAEKGHGLFTYFLLKKLQETSGNVDYGTLNDFIRKEVSRRAIVVNNKPQTPTVVCSPAMSDSWRELKLR